MKKLKPWQIVLLVMFYPVGIVYLIYRILRYLFNSKNMKGKTFYNGRHAETNNKIDSINLKNASELKTDLVEADYLFGCCAECAKYRGRVFSISGDSDIFPKKPEYIDCSCSGIVFYPFFYKISEPNVWDYIGRKVDIVKFSNRPFIDDRTQAEKEMYELDIQRIANEEQKEKDRFEYNTLLEIFPNDVPKSFGAYRRMKNANSSGFAKIKILAEKAGIEIK